MTEKPIHIRMGGYGPPTTGFSKALQLIGARVTAEFGERVRVHYVWNILDLGYRAEDILWMVEEGLLTLGYQSSSYLTDRVPEIEILDLPFLFETNEEARGAMDGAFGDHFARAIEAKMNYRILGWFENGFRHISNRLRPVRRLADLKAMRIRVLPSAMQVRTFELLGAEPLRMDLSEAIAMVKAGTLDAQENPLANTVTYGVVKFHPFHTLTRHSYLSRPIFLNRDAFDGWPGELQDAMRRAVRDAVALQRKLAVEEHDNARAAIEKEGREIIELAPAERAAFVRAVGPIFAEAQDAYGRDAFALLPKAINARLMAS